MNSNHCITLTRSARQRLETLQLLGVNVVPVGTLGGDSNQSSPEPPSLSQRDRGPSADGIIEVKVAALADLRKRHDAECAIFSMISGFTQTVFGEGNPDANLMFIGEAPGAEEDRTGRPFVGRAGQKLDDIIHAMGLKRADVYIANVLKVRPPDNRTPLPHEVDASAPYLEEQVRIIEPRVIVTLGGPATKLLLKTDEGITRLRGQWAAYSAAGRDIPVMPTFHPAYLLRNYTRETREKVWSDMQAVLQRLNGGG